MESLAFESVQCPYCGEWIELTIDRSVGEQHYVEDCSVCCRPIEISLIAMPDGLRVEARRDDD